MNLVIEKGNLTKDVELKYLQDGTAVANFSIAVNEKYKSKLGELKENVDFFNVTAWGKIAENCAEYLQKGSPVLIEGKLKQERWESEGKTQSRVKIIATKVDFLSFKKDGQKQEIANMNTETNEDIPF